MSEISGEARLRESDYIAGIKHIAPLLVAMVPISLVFGGLAAQKGLSPLEVLLMSAVVFAGGSQFVAIDFWGQPSAMGRHHLLCAVGECAPYFDERLTGGLRPGTWAGASK